MEIKKSLKIDSFAISRDANVKVATTSSLYPTLNAIAKLLNVSAQAILNWIRDYAKVSYEKPELGRAVVVELDEFWHFIAMDLGSRRLIDWELGGRDNQTLRKLLERLTKWQVKTIGKHTAVSQKVIM